MANVPSDPGGGEPGGPRTADPRRDGGVATKRRAEVARPPRFKVILYNDDYTPMEFVVAVLEQIFGKGPAQATQIMLQIHRTGLGVAGVYVLEVAETKVAAVHRSAEEHGYPLRSGVEKE
jgi:ATP-dependent Clp protease adaptor protein ClpS